MATRSYTFRTLFSTFPSFNLPLDGTVKDAKEKVASLCKLSDLSWDDIIIKKDNITLEDTQKLTDIYKFEGISSQTLNVSYIIKSQSKQFEGTVETLLTLFSKLGESEGDGKKNKKRRKPKSYVNKKSKRRSKRRSKSKSKSKKRNKRRSRK